MLKLIQHLKINEDGTVPETPACLFAYLMAGNGVFIKAQRKGLDVLIPVSEMRIAGLPAMTPYVSLASRVPQDLLFSALELSQQNFPNEVLCWFNLKNRWRMDVPQQVTRPSHVVPLNKTDGNGTSALIDLHSHGALPPFFSQTDNQDEQGFRVYVVIGEVHSLPRICVRVGVYGNYFNIPASTVFEMPDEIVDAYPMKGIKSESAIEQG